MRHPLKQSGRKGSGHRDQQKGIVNVPPGLSEVEGQSADSMAVRGKLDREIACGPRVKEHAFSLLPARLAGALNQVSEQLIEIGRGKSPGSLVSADRQRLLIKLRVEDDGAARTTEAHVGLHAWHQLQRIRIGSNELPPKVGCADTPSGGQFVLVKIPHEVLKKQGQPTTQKVAKA